MINHVDFCPCPENAQVTNESVWFILTVCVCPERRLCSTLPCCRLWTEWENVLTTAVNEEKKRRGRKRSAVKVAEAHKRKERNRKSLLSLIRLSASLSSFREPKHEPTFFLLFSVFLLPSEFFILQLHMHHLSYPLCHPICLSKGRSRIVSSAFMYKAALTDWHLLNVILTVICRILLSSLWGCWVLTGVEVGEGAHAWQRIHTSALVCGP